MASSPPKLTLKLDHAKIKKNEECNCALCGVKEDFLTTDHARDLDGATPTMGVARVSFTSAGQDLEFYMVVFSSRSHWDKVYWSRPASPHGTDREWVTETSVKSAVHSDAVEATDLLAPSNANAPTAPAAISNLVQNRRSVLTGLRVDFLPDIAQLCFEHAKLLAEKLEAPWTRVTQAE
jgi:hypothetical protein